ncbi:vitamin K epoxide reductase family protein [Spirochaetota bacterium]
MKKYAYPILILSFVGAIISCLILVQHYFPASKLGVMACGDKIVNPCTAVSHSDYSIVFGIPLAAFGLFFYLLIIFLILVADYAEGAYNNGIMAIIFPLSIASIIINLFLAGILIKINAFCHLCFSTYMVNLAVLIIMLLWLKSIRKENILLKDIYKGFLSLKDSSSNKKAAFASFLLFIFFLLFSVLSTSYNLGLKAQGEVTPESEIKHFIEELYSKKAVKLNLPKSKMTLGNPKAKLNIIVFIDFLCSACYDFYKTEKYILSKFKDKVKITFYNLPLDDSCYSDIKNSSSCISQKALTSSANLGIFKEYLMVHFKNYNSYNGQYDKSHAHKNFNKLASSKKLMVDLNKFIETLNSQEIQGIIKSHILAGDNLKVKATPTLFIGGRKLVGGYPKEILNVIIKRELAALKK